MYNLWTAIMITTLATQHISCWKISAHSLVKLSILFKLTSWLSFLCICTKSIVQWDLCVYFWRERSGCSSRRCGEGSAGKHKASPQCESWCVCGVWRNCWWCSHKMSTDTPICWSDHHYHPCLPCHRHQHRRPPCQPSCPTPTGKKQPRFRATNFTHSFVNKKSLHQWIVQ